MRMMVLSAMLVLTGCASFRNFMSGGQCTVPDAREAKITKRVWTK